jgi:hypothetical protein
MESLLGGRSGIEKKNAAISFAQTALSMASAIESREMVDEAGFKSGLSTAINGVVMYSNASVRAEKPISANPPQA